MKTIVNNSNNIEGKVVIITGARNSGLVEASTKLLSERGATVVLSARRAELLKSLFNIFAALILDLILFLKSWIKRAI